MKINTLFDSKRWKSALLRRFSNLGFGLPVRQLETFGQGANKLLLVSSGAIPIPSTGWGAVEKIITETIPYLIDSGFQVTLLNSKHKNEWKIASKDSYSVILCHDDASFFKIDKYFPDTPTVAVTHYGLLPLPEEWDASYVRVLKSIVAANVLVVLSEACKRAVSNLMPLANIRICPNGVEPENYVQAGARNRAIYLGKIESRKRQLEIAKRYPNLEIDFVGPCEKTLIDTYCESQGIRFLGEKNREWLRDNLAKYEVGILLSLSEADALVLYEYQNAGLKILASEGAIGAQDPSLPWIQISNLDNLESDLSKLRNISIPHELIARFAIENYTWTERLKPLVSILREVGR